MDFPVFGKEGSVTLVEGKKRTGKTLLVSLLSLMLADRGIKGFSNYFLGSSNVSRIDFYQFLCLLEHEPFVPYTFVALQEIYGWANSHKALSDNSEGFDMVNYQGGKKNINFIGDTQVIGRALQSLREMADYRFEAEKQALCNKPLCPDSCVRLKECCYVYHEVDVQFPDDTVYTDDDFVISFAFAKKFIYHRYDTVEYSKPLGYDALKLKLQINNPAIMSQTIQEQVELVFVNRSTYGIESPKDCRVIRVKDALISLGVPDVFGDHVADRLQWQWSTLFEREANELASKKLAESPDGW